MKSKKLIKLIAAALLSVSAVNSTTNSYLTYQTVQAAKKTKNKKAKTFKIKLKKNAKVFTKQGKRKGQKDLKKGQIYTVYDKKTIHGKKYYRLSKSRYIKAINAKKVSSKSNVPVAIMPPADSASTDPEPSAITPLTTYTDDDGFEKAKVNPAYNAPTIENFDQAIINKYHLENHRWKKITITYNTDEIDQNSISYVKRVIKQINNLHLVNLIPGNDKANANIIITTDNSNDDNYIQQHYDTGKNTFGLTSFKPFRGSQHKGLYEDTQNHVLILPARIGSWITIESKTNYKSAFMTVTAHELGHALGLAHSENNGDDIMSKYSTTRRISNDKQLLDNHYKQSLATIYQN